MIVDVKLCLFLWLFGFSNEVDRVHMPYAVILSVSDVQSLLLTSFVVLVIFLI